jgi:hypothetical protein
MFDQPPRERVRTDLPIKGIVLFGVGVGLSFGLCGVSLVAGFNSWMPNIVIGTFLLSATGLVVCLIWLVVAGIVNSFRR